jgi:molybdopterin-guanine dinucleotide biosynthesis protein A
MGDAKPLMRFRQAMLIDAVIARAAPQVARLAIDVHCEEAPAYRARYGDAALPDLFGERLGPLCGVVTGLAWLEAEWLATFPCDTPFLPLDLVAQLARNAVSRPVVARHGGRLHGVCGLWPKTCLAKLKAGVESGALRSMRSALDACEAIECEIAAAPNAFFNINTPDDLKRAETLNG